MKVLTMQPQLHCHNGPDRIWRQRWGDPGCDPVPGRAGGPGGMHHDPAAGGGFLLPMRLLGSYFILR